MWAWCNLCVWRSHMGKWDGLISVTIWGQDFWIKLHLGVSLPLIFFFFFQLKLLSQEFFFSSYVYLMYNWGNKILYKTFGTDIFLKFFISICLEFVIIVMFNQEHLLLSLCRQENKVSFKMIKEKGVVFTIYMKYR